MIEYCSRLRVSIQEHQKSIAIELGRNRDDTQPSQIIGAWRYSLDTIIQEAQSRTTCSWTIEGVEDAMIDDSDGGDVTLRRV